MPAHQNTSNCIGPCPTPPQLQLYQTIIFVTPVLFACLLLVLFCVLYMRRRRYSFHASQMQVESASRSLPVHDQGLSKSFRQKLPTIPFDEKFAASREDNQCAVCLGDYQLNDKLQELPVCKHLFHVSCIDEWLAKNTTCPICRTSLIHQEERESSDVSRRGEGNRRWEERVVSDVQEGNLVMRLETSVGDEGSGSSSSRGSLVVAMATAAAETARHLSGGEHAINIERS